MSKRAKDYQSKEKEGDNASKGGKGRGPPVDGPPVDGPPVDGPPVDGTQAGTTQTESSLSTMTVQPSDDPTGSIGDLANDIVPADNMPIHSSQKPGQSLHDPSVKGSGSTVQGASAGGNMSGNGTKPKKSGPVPSTNADVKSSGSTVQGSAASRNMSGHGTRPKTSWPVPSTSAVRLSTSSPAEPVDWEELDHYIDIAFSVVSMYNVTMLLIEMLAYSIYSMGNQMSNLQHLISEWQSHGIKVPYAEVILLRSSVNELIQWFVRERTDTIQDGTPIRDIFLDAFGVAFDNFFKSDEREALSKSVTKNLRSLIEEAYKKDGDKTRLHTVPGISAQDTIDMMSFLKDNLVARGNFFKGLTVEIIRTTGWTVSALNKSTKTEQLRACPKLEADIDKAYNRVKHMIHIRNKIVHEDCKFTDCIFGNTYKNFIEAVDHGAIHPERTLVNERERLEKPVNDAAQFKKLRVHYKNLMADNNQLKAKDDKITQLNREIETQDAALARSGRAVTELTQTKARQQQTITGHEQTITGQQQTITGQQQTITGQQQTITGQQQTITGQKQTIAGHEQTIADLLRVIEQLQRREDN